MRELYICDTPYQTFNVLNIAYNRETKMKKERILSFIKVVWLPILVALIPQFYQEITAPKVELQYEVSYGPAVLEDSLYKKIVVVSLYNTGSKNSNNIVGKINVIDGRVKTYSYSVTDPLKPDIIHDKNIIELSMPSMMPSSGLPTLMPSTFA